VVSNAGDACQRSRMRPAGGWPELACSSAVASVVDWWLSVPAGKPADHGAWGWTSLLLTYSSAGVERKLWADLYALPVAARGVMADAAAITPQGSSHTPLGGLLARTRSRCEMAAIELLELQGEEVEPVWCDGSGAGTGSPRPSSGVLWTREGGGSPCSDDATIFLNPIPSKVTT